LLHELPVFAGLSDAQLALIVPIARLEDFPEGASILRQGGEATDIRVVVSGKVSLCLELGGGRELCMLTMTRGDIVGWSALLDQATWLASATAVKPTTVLAADGRALRALCESNHEIGFHLMRNLFSAASVRLHDTRLQLLDMYGSHA